MAYLLLPLLYNYVIEYGIIAQHTTHCTNKVITLGTQRLQYNMIIMSLFTVIVVGDM